MVKKLVKLILAIVILILLLILAGLGFLTVTEFKPADSEILTVRGPGVDGNLENPEAKAGKVITLMTWNIGYGALGDDADFFMDGGTGVRAEDEDRLNYNLTNITSQIKYQKPDVVLLQEVDTDSDRSLLLDEAQRIATNMTGYVYDFATNYKCAYIPYPWPTIGKVDAGLMTFSRFKISEAERVSLPSSSSWPKRMCNLKRCLAVNRIPVAGGEKELVVVNLHLEAYDHGELRNAQANVLKEILENETGKGNYVIAGGDFNQIFSVVDGSAYPTYEGNWECMEMDCSDFDSSWQFLMDNQTPSRRYLNKPYAGEDKDTFQYYLIDGFIVSSNVEVISCETKDIGFQFSDHNPVVLKVKLY